MGVLNPVPLGHVPGGLRLHVRGSLLPGLVRPVAPDRPGSDIGLGHPGGFEKPQVSGPFQPLARSRLMTIRWI